jgi:ribosomal small subunit pseudouridine synthase A (EC 5.4.99.-)
MGDRIRIDKYLSEMNMGTRSEIRELIRRGRVSINGIPCRKPDEKVDTDSDTVSLDGQKINYEKYVYLMLNKPAGVVSATTDNREKTVIDLIKDSGRKDIFPVGRLDKDTEGLLILTNDGRLAHNLLSPKKEVDKVYYAKVKGRVTEQDVNVFLSGISIGENEPCLPARLEILVSGDISEVNLTIQEGKFHQVKRMFEAVGKKVIYLKRISMGGLRLDPGLKPGDYRRLTKDEIEYLKNIT